MQWDGMFTMHGWMWLWWVLVLLVIVAVAIWLLRAARSASDRPRDQSPEQILKQRFARGEIDEQEYEEKLKQLRR